MYKVGELVKRRCPLDEDYSYGYILGVKRNVALVVGTGYYSRTTTKVHLKYIKKVRRGGGCGQSKKYSKSSTTQIEL